MSGGNKKFIFKMHNNETQHEKGIGDRGKAGTRERGNRGTGRGRKQAARKA